MQRAVIGGCAVLLFSFCGTTQLGAQSHTCPAMVSRNNGNGQSNSCPGVGGTLVATNVVAAYLGVPAGSKTGDIVWRHISTDAWYTNPPVILAAYTTSSGTSSSINSYPGPPGTPSSGNVKYCFYAGVTGNGNLPNSGIVSFRFATPVNITDYMVCTYDFGGSNALIVNPATVPVAPLLIHFSSFTVKRTVSGAELSWTVSGNSNEVARYSVERSADGINFNEIHTINHAPATEYSYSDKEAGVFSSRIYYRIRETDYDGQSVTTSIRELAPEPTEGITLGFTGDDVLIKCAAGVNGILQYIDMAGRIIKQENATFAAGINKISLNTGTSSPVAVRLITGNEIYSCKCSRNF
ncbi:hypothetical protein ACTHGU_01125 [Chitinophagaceae bacterium MMS25-I14]